MGPVGQKGIAWRVSEWLQLNGYQVNGEKFLQKFSCMSRGTFVKYIRLRWESFVTLSRNLLFS